VTKVSDTVVTAKFVADTTSLQAGAQRVTTSLRGVDDGVRKTALSMNALKAGMIGVGAAVGALAIKMGVDAVKAAAEEEQAVVKLATALKNVGQEFRLSEVEGFIDDLQRTVAVTDDDLRPALQALVTATGDVTQAQDLLGIALDVSAATGRDLTSVSVALAKASNGQMMQINRLTNGAINPAILSTKDLALVTGELDKLYGGQAQASADTFAGKIKKLEIAFNELMEAFGEGFIEGITEGTTATDDIGVALRAAEPGMKEFGKTVGEVGKIFSYVSPFFDDVVNTFKVAIPSALGSAAAVFPPAAGLVAFLGTTFFGTKQSVDAYVAATERQAMTSGTVQAALKATGTAVTGVGDAAEEAAEQLAAMKAEMDLFLESTGQISAVDRAAESIDNLGAASVEFGTNLMGQSPKARGFRAEVVSAFEDSAKAAQSLSDDLPTQRAIFTGELIKIVASLRASGVKPADIEAFLGAMDGLPASVSDIMRSAAKAIGDTDFKTQVEKAFDKSVKAGAPMTADAMERLAQGASKAAKSELGLTLEPELASIIKSGTTALRPTAFLNGELTGKSIGSGVAYGINQSSPIVQAAIARVMAQAKAAADAAVESNSPSRLFAETGDDMVSGVAMGWIRTAPTLFRAITSIIPTAQGESSKLATAMADAFSESLRENGGSVAAAIQDIFGSIPTKTPLEVELGVKGAEKFIKNNKKALADLVTLGEAIDRINEKVRFAGEAFTSLGELVARPFGRQSQIAEMFGSESDIDSVIDGFLSVRDQVKDAYSVLTDASIVGEKAAARNRAEMQKTIGQLRALTAQAVQLRQQYYTVMQELETLEKDYQKSIADTNAFYDAAEKKAEENIKAIEDRWASAIPGLEAALKGANEAFDKENAVLQNLISQRDEFVGQIKSGFRSFVNSLSFESRSASKQIVKETQRLANGITVTLERELEVGGGPAAIRQTLEERLAAVRDFSRNIRTLMQRGLDPALVQDFVSAGVAGAGEAAAALAAGSQEDLAAINSVQSQLLAETEDFGKYASAQWHDIGIAQQQAIVTPLEIARDAAQKALDDANALRDQELAAARKQLETLRSERQAALAAIDAAYNAEKSALQAQATALQAEMDAVAAQIEQKILTMLNRTAAKSAEAGVKAGAGLLEGFRKEYPGVYQKLNTLMDQLAASLTRTATVTVQTVYDSTVPVQQAGRNANRTRAAFTPEPTGVNVGTMSVPVAGSGPAGGAINTFHITVNAGMGADGAEIGRLVVDSLRQYERRNGPIPVSVTG
jgi:ABC-type phosphate transport system auxiliary subunit